MQPLNFFISYAHKDEELMQEFFEFLQPLIQSKKISVWSDKAIGVGDLWDDGIKKALQECDVIVFLISPSFLASSYINRIEIATAFQLRKEKKLQLVPVMLRACDLDSHIVEGEEYRIKDFQGLPKAMKPVVSWSTHDDAWSDVIAGIKRLIP